jgi:Protein of unknown function (DUF1153)
MMTALLTGVMPPADIPRWSPRRKAEVVDAVRDGAISFADACLRYQLSTEEFVSWQRAIEANGVPGLRVTRVQIYRGSLRPHKRPHRRSNSALFSRLDARR